jgi:hypothetical protein
MGPEEILRTLAEERERGEALIREVATLDDLRTTEVALLGRKSPVARVQKSLGALDAAERPRIGQAVNDRSRTSASGRSPRAIGST